MYASKELLSRSIPLLGSSLSRLSSSCSGDSLDPNVVDIFSALSLSISFHFLFKHAIGICVFVMAIMNIVVNGFSMTHIKNWYQFLLYHSDFPNGNDAFCVVNIQPVYSISTELYSPVSSGVCQLAISPSGRENTSLNSLQWAYRLLEIRNSPGWPSRSALIPSIISYQFGASGSAYQTPNRISRSGICHDIVPVQVFKFIHLSWKSAARLYSRPLDDQYGSDDSTADL